MSIFDELGKKVTSTSQNVAQKTKDMAEIARINSLVSDEEKRINNGYYQIGKQYVALHENDYEGNYAELIHMIKDSENKIRMYNKQIQDIKGVRRCPSCGAEVPVNAVFCNSCGARIPAVEMAGASEGMARCANCGALVKAGMKFCTSCGTPIQAMEKPETESKGEDSNILDSELEEIQTPAESKTLRCPSCGHIQEDDSLFCTECGARMETE